MSEAVIRYAFIAGELSPNLFGRGDLEKYDLGLALAENFFVDYRGGITTRGGTEFVGEIQHADQEVKIVPFTFANNIENTYLLVFGDEYLRFVQDGGYVLEAAKTITGITQATPGVVTTSAAHGFTTGDWVNISGVGGMTEVNARLFEVGTTTATTFQLLDPVTGSGVATGGYTAYTSGGSAARVYTVTTPYAAEDLYELRVVQEKDDCYLTHTAYPTQKLTRSAATSWALADFEVNASGTAPGSPTLTPSAAGSAGVAFAVSAVSDDGESRISRPTITEVSVNYASVAGSMEVTWTGVAGVKYYNVYRSIIVPTGTQATLALELGFLGRTYGPRFVDNNIIPDFTQAPPIGQDPFAINSILSIDVTAGGAGYAKTDTITVTDVDGTGFVGYPIVNNAGAIIAVRVVDGGKNYTAPSVSASGGAGATFSVNKSPATGTYPRTAAKFQQRLALGGSLNNPLTVYGSRPGQFENFDVTIPPISSDAYAYTMDSQRNDPILHMVSLQGGMLVMTASGVWQLKGKEGETVTALSAVADPQVFAGVSLVEPLLIDTDVFYTQAKGALVRRLTFNQFSTSYTGEDMSTLSNHMFGVGDKEILRMAYAEGPYQVLWAPRSDGSFLAMTYVKEQNVNGWTRHRTKGRMKDCALVEENNVDVVYWVVERYIKGTWTKYIERMTPPVYDHVEEAWQVDCGLRYPLTYPAATINISAATGTATVTASASVFSAGDVGSIIRAGGGKMEITSYTSGTEVDVTIHRGLTNVIHGTTTPYPVIANEWSLGVPTTTVSGLWHLEGETVTALCDGNVLPDTVVVNGAIEIPYAASMIVVGIPYQCKGKTLPLTFPSEVIEGRRSRIIGTAVRMLDSRGLAFGEDEGQIYELPERAGEPWGEPTTPISGVRYRTVAQEWIEGGALYWEQNYPVPASIIGIVLDIDVGDDNK